jgi:hypothetical protein
VIGRLKSLMLMWNDENEKVSINLSLLVIKVTPLHIDTRMDLHWLMLTKNLM